MKVQFKMKSANMELSGTATQDASFWHGAVIGFSTMFKATGGESETCSLDLTVDDEALEGSLDEVLSEFQHRIGDAMMSAGEWARCGRGVIGPLMGSELEGRIRSTLPREHGPRCNGVPCYCDDLALVADGTYFDAARENHLYFIGPNLYVAESEEAARQLHCDSVVDSKRRLEEMRQSIIDDAPSVAELASVHIDAMIVEVNKTYEVRHIAEDEALPDIVELSDEENVQTSPKSYDEWRRGKMGSVGLLRSYWVEIVTPHVAALIKAAGVAGERRLQEVRGKLGIGEGT